MPQLACADFITVDDVLGATCACDLTLIDDGDLIAEFIGDVSDILYLLSEGRVSGRCTRTVWPVPVAAYGCWPRRPSNTWLDYSWGGYTDAGMVIAQSQWVDSQAIPLMGPATEVIEVTIDGIVLNPSEYLLLNGNMLLRREGSWPLTNDVTLADTEEGTFTITEAFGNVPGPTTKRAAIELVCQMIKSDSQALSRLRGVVSANVQGVSVQMDPDEINEMGLPELSRFIDTYGGGRHARVGVYSPELNHGWRLFTVTGGSGS